MTIKWLPCRDRTEGKKSFKTRPGSAQSSKIWKVECLTTGPGSSYRNISGCQRERDGHVLFHFVSYIKQHLFTVEIYWSLFDWSRMIFGKLDNSHALDLDWVCLKLIWSQLKIIIRLMVVTAALLEVTGSDLLKFVVSVFILQNWIFDLKYTIYITNKSY